MRRDFGADSLAYSSQPPQNQVDWQYRRISALHWSRCCFPAREWHRSQIPGSLKGAGLLRQAI